MIRFERVSMERSLIRSEKKWTEKKDFFPPINKKKAAHDLIYYLVWLHLGLFQKHFMVAGGLLEKVTCRKMNGRKCNSQYNVEMEVSACCQILFLI